MEISGKLKLVLNEETFASGFNKRSFVIGIESNYPYDICFDLLKDKVRMVDGFQIGEEIKVSFDIRSREYNGKWFTGCTAWRIEKAGAGSAPSGNAAPQYGNAAPAPVSADAYGSVAPAAAPSAPSESEDDDLPF
jgi:single-strand DNA-binding protein